MPVEWPLPVAVELYKNRKEIFSVWDKIITKTLGAKSRIAFVGPAGVGKSVLLDHITGKAFKRGYKAPGKSSAKESGGAKTEGKRLALTVSPGHGGPKYDTYSEIFDPKNPADGLVFVAGAGFITLRDPRAEQVNISRGFDTIDKWRSSQRSQELRDLEEVVISLRRLLRASRKPSWLLVAVTKVDLFYDMIETEKDYYSPHGGSEFARLLNNLVANAGSDNFEWQAAPVCSSLDPFEWNRETTIPKISTEARDHFLASFVDILGDICR